MNPNQPEAKMKTNQESESLANHLYDWLSKQKYGNQEILHAAVCCDYAGMIHFKKAIAGQIEEFYKIIDQS